MNAAAVGAAEHAGEGVEIAGDHDIGTVPLPTANSVTTPPSMTAWKVTLPSGDDDTAYCTVAEGVTSRR